VEILTLSTSAFRSHPVSAYFDPVSDPCDRALYVALDGRGIIRLDPIPTPGMIVVQPCGGVVATQWKTCIAACRLFMEATATLAEPKPRRKSLLLTSGASCSGNSVFQPINL
jgi:hypothetical protein